MDFTSSYTIHVAEPQYSTRRHKWSDQSHLHRLWRLVVATGLAFVLPCLPQLMGMLLGASVPRILSKWSQCPAITLCRRFPAFGRRRWCSGQSRRYCHPSTMPRFPTRLPRSPTAATMATNSYPRHQQLPQPPTATRVTNSYHSHQQYLNVEMNLGWMLGPFHPGSTDGTTVQ